MAEMVNPVSLTLLEEAKKQYAAAPPAQKASGAEASNTELFISVCDSLNQLSIIMDKLDKAVKRSWEQKIPKNPEE